MAPNTNTADVYVIDYNNIQQHVGKGINKKNLMLLSVSANNAFQTPTSPSKGNKSAKTSDRRLFILHEDKSGAPSAEPEAAKIICKWIDAYDGTKPIESQVLTLEHLPQADGGPTIQQVVHLYHTAYAFRLHRERRGNALRDEISRYVHSGPLSENEFRMIHDLLSFDDGILKASQHSLIYAQVHGLESPKNKEEKRENKIVQDKNGVWHVYSRPDPEEMNKIEAFAKERGIWEAMEDARRTIVCQKEEVQLNALQFQTREAHRRNDRKAATALRLQVIAKQEAIKQLKYEMTAIKKDRESKEKALEEAAKQKEETAKKKVEQEEARKQKQKPK